MHQKAPKGCFYTPVNKADRDFQERKLAKEGYRLAEPGEPILFTLHIANWQERFDINYTKRGK